MAEQEDSKIKDAQYRKGLSIAFFNATNSATDVVVAKIRAGEKMDAASILATLREVRDELLGDHAKHYLANIATVGVPYKAEDAIERINKTKDAKELRKLWFALTADERADQKILDAKEVMKKKHENA